jgi:hypothetical protein
MLTNVFALMIKGGKLFSLAVIKSFGEPEASLI